VIVSDPVFLDGLTGTVDLSTLIDSP